MWPGWSLKSVGLYSTTGNVCCVLNLACLFRLDVYRKIPQDLTEATLTGAIISLTCIVLIIFLFIVELKDYLTPEMWAGIWVPLVCWFPLFIVRQSCTLNLVASRTMNEFQWHWIFPLPKWPVMVRLWLNLGEESLIILFVYSYRLGYSRFEWPTRGGLCGEHW